MPQNGINHKVPFRRGKGWNRFVTGGAYINALDFDGVNDYMQVAGLVGFATPTRWTFMCWVWVDVLTVGRRIIQTAASPSAESILLQWEGLNWGLYVGTNVSPVVLASGATGVWNHFAVVVDKSPSNVKSYWNGVLANNYTPAAQPASFIDFLLMGNASAARIDGRMDEVLLFSRALTQAEIVTIINGGIAPGNFDSTSLELYLPCNQIDAGPVTPDISGAGRNATLFNGPTLIPRP
jgi:hypothetical protein